MSEVEEVEEEHKCETCEAKRTREKSEVEISWEDGKFEEDLRKLDAQITKDIWAHDQLQSQFKNENYKWKVLMGMLSVIFGVAVAFCKEYAPEYSNTVSEIGLIVIIPALLSFYSWRDPAGKRSAHILVSGQKADTQGKITLQLIQKPKKRELARTFYQWIHAEYARVGGNAEAYLPGYILDRYDRLHKKTK